MKKAIKLGKRLTTKRIQFLDKTNKSRTQKEKADVIINQAKWKSAAEWTKRKGIRFRVLNEDSIYAIK